MKFLTFQEWLIDEGIVEGGFVDTIYWEGALSSYEYDHHYDKYMETEHYWGPIEAKNKAIAEQLEKEDAIEVARIVEELTAKEKH
jgi:hypothetical protein